MATMSTKLFGTSKKDKKSKKEIVKLQNASDHLSSAIQSPMVALCRKLVVHQNCIMQQVETITNSLEPKSTTKPSSYGAIVTELLMQLDCAISTTQQCLTKDIFERNPQLKSLLKDSERVMFANVALLVKWADFAGRDASYCMHNEYIFFCVRAFKDALNDFVRLVAENSDSSSSSTLPNNSQLGIENHKMRRASVNDALLNRVELAGGIVPINGNTLSTPGVPNRSFSAKQKRTMSKDSLNSDSGDSDVTNNRRSGSNDRHEFTDSDINPLPNGSRYHGNSSQDVNGTISKLTGVPFTNITNGVSTNDPDIPPPLPVKKRKQLQQMMNSPHTSPTHAVTSSVATNVPNSTYTPPIPMRSPGHRRRDDYEVPPPVPIKKRERHSMGNTFTPGSVPTQFIHNAPPLPIRIDSIEGLRDKIAHAPPPKPPRTDPGGVVESYSEIEGDKLLKYIDKYNQSIKNKQLSEDEAPPVPLKKRTLLASQHLFTLNNYTFDDSSIPSLNIPDMTAPPPLPPKKRHRKPTTSSQQHHHNPNNKHSPATGMPRGRKEGSVGSLDELELSSDELDPNEEPVQFLEVDDVTPYLKFEQDDKGGGYTLLGGPLDALIAYAASTSSSVRQYTEAFLSTYYTLISSDELIFKLLIRLQYFYKEGNAPLWQATTSLLVRVLNNMKTQLIKEAEITLIELLDTMLRDGQLKFAQLVRNGIIEKLNQKIPEFIPLSVAMCSNSKTHRAITDFDATEVAKQMTILDADYFFRVDIQEMLFWAKDHDEEKCPQLTLFTTHFNNVSQWCQTRLLEKDIEWRKREKLMIHFIHIMKALREYNNFNSYLAILSAIESANVSRLDWSDKIIRSLEEPRALIDSRGSFKNYRQAFATTKPPCIPYIGLYLQDLTFLEEQPNKLQDKVSINFGKRWKQFKSVDHIRFAQTKPYTLDVEPTIMGVFSGFKDHEDNKVLYQRSLEIKPSNRQRIANTQS